MGIGPNLSVITVSTAGTRTRIIVPSTYVVSFYVEAATANAGKIYFGDSTVTSTKYTTALSAGAGFGVASDAQGRPATSAGGGEIQLNSFWVDASSSGDKVMLTYFERVGVL